MDPIYGVHSFCPAENGTQGKFPGISRVGWLKFYLWLCCFSASSSPRISEAIDCFWDISGQRINPCSSGGSVQLRCIGANSGSEPGDMTILWFPSCVICLFRTDSLTVTRKLFSSPWLKVASLPEIILAPP